MRQASNDHKSVVVVLFSLFMIHMRQASNDHKSVVVVLFSLFMTVAYFATRVLISTSSDRFFFNKI